MEVPIVRQILKANDQVALENRTLFDAAHLRVVNIMAAPGAGKTSLILSTIERLPPGLRAGVIEGDIASSIDADRIAAAGIPVVQINTGGNCHLDAPMIRAALPHLDLAALDVLFIENVGNLICPANYRLGADLAVVIGSVPEGDDKPFKYPGIFASADIVLLNKYDLRDVFAFDTARFTRGVHMVNEPVSVLPLSCRDGFGVDVWVEWLCARVGAAALA